MREREKTKTNFEFSFSQNHTHTHTHKQKKNQYCTITIVIYEREKNGLNIDFIDSHLSCVCVLVTKRKNVVFFHLCFTATTKYSRE